MARRLSTELILNASTTYVRLGLSFVMGIFFVWFVVGEVGLAGLGLIGISIGAFGFSAALESTVNQSLGREISAAVASGDEKLVERTFVSALGFSALGAVAVVATASTLAGLAYLGVFRTVEGYPELNTALAVLFLSEAVRGGLSFLMAPYGRALYASKRVALDNLVFVLQKSATVGAAVIAFAWWAPDAPLHERLYWFAAANAGLWIAVILFAALMAKALVRGLRIRPRSFDRVEFRTIAATVWHTGKFKASLEFNAQFMGLLINLFFGVAYNGIWDIVVRIGGHAMMVAQGALHGIDPIATHLKASGQAAGIRDLMARTIRYQLAVSLPWMVAYIGFMTPILMLWVSGRLERDEALGQAGITAAEAIALIGLMGTIQIMVVLSRMSVQGVERMLYGLGEVRSYAWFAKYALVLTVGGGALMFAVTDSVIMAPIVLLVVHVLVYQVVVPRAAQARVDLDLAATAKRSLPRPLAAAAVLAGVVMVARIWIDELTLPGLAAVALGLAAIYLPLLIGIVAEPDERRLAWRLLRRIAGRGDQAPA